jgi:hypothetical protein
MVLLAIKSYGDFSPKERVRNVKPLNALEIKIFAVSVKFHRPNPLERSEGVRFLEQRTRSQPEL